MLKKISPLSIAILAAANALAANVWDGSVATTFSVGKGTVAEPYQISNGAELALFAQKVSEGDTALSAVLTDDIYLNEGSENYASWGETPPANAWPSPIGSTQHRFEGVFDGKGHKVYGAYQVHELTNTLTGYGFFGVVGDSATIKNLAVEHSYVQMTAEVNESSAAKNPHVGVIIGSAAGGHYTNLSASGVVKVSSKVTATSGTFYSENGCIAGYLSKKFIIVNAAANCQIESSLEASAAISLHHSLGGLVGKIQGTGFIENVYSRSSVKNTSPKATSGEHFGGLIGHLQNATDTLYNAYYDISVIGSENFPTAATGTSSAVTKNVASKISSKMKTADFANLLGPAFTYTASQNNGYPQLVIFEGATAFDGGNGTESSPYLISSAKALRAMSGLVNGMNAEFGNKHYKMTADVELNEDSETYKSWETTPPEFSWFQIGREYHRKDSVSVDCGSSGGVSCSKSFFKGVFDGAHHKVKGIFINDTTNQSQGGLFYVTDSATIKNLGVINSYLSVKGRAAGIVGVAVNTKIDSVFNSAEIRSISQDNGGIAGVIFHSEISNSYNNGNIKVTKVNRSVWSSGGIVGEVFRESKITNVWNSGNVSALQANAGGIAGYVDSSIILNVYNRGNVSSDSMTGGVVGTFRVSSIMKGAYSTGTVSSKIAAKRGGVIGVMQERTSPKVRNIVSDCYYNSQAVGTSNAPTAAIGTTAGTVTNTSALPTATMTTGRFAIMLGNAYKQNDAVNDGYPTFLAEGETYGVVDIFAGGDGSENNPFQIATATQLRNMEYLVNKKNSEYGASHYKLIADIVLNENTANYTTWNTTAPANTWTPMGSDTTVSFKGVFDGGNYSISGIYSNAKFSGLFGVVDAGAVVKNVTIKESLLKTTNRSGRVGSIAGYAKNAAIENVTNEGNIYGLYASSVGYDTLSCVGGIVGYMYGGTLKSATNRGSVQGHGTGIKSKVSRTLSNSAGISVGGITGIMYLAAGEDLSNYGSVDGKCVSMDSVWSKVAVGGITAGLYSSSLTNVQNQGSLSVHGADSAKLAPSWPRLGGIAGAITTPGGINSTISKCSNTGNMTGMMSSVYTAETPAIAVGGVVGRINGGTGDVVIERCKNEGDINSTSKYAKTAHFAGGLVAYMDNTNVLIVNSYSKGRIALQTTETSSPKTASVNAGGLVGRLGTKGVLKGSFFYGTLTSTVSATTKDERVGGLVGNSGGSVVGSYFDKTVAGNMNVIGNNTGIMTKALALATGDMQTNEFAWKLNTFGGDSTNTGAFTRYNDYPEFGDSTYLPIYRVVFDDAVDINNIYTSYSGYVKAPVDPEPAPGEMFVGWTDGDKYMLQSRQVIDHDMTLYALFTLVTQPIYSITFVNGSDVYVKATETTGKLKTLPVAKNIPMGYHFDGWYDNETDALVTTETVFTGTATAVAKFSANLYKITFLDFDGTEISSIDEPYGQMPKIPADPRRAATGEYTYVFAGWDHEVTLVSGDASYVAVYDSTAVVASSSSEESSSSIVPPSSSSEESSSSIVPPSSSSEESSSSVVPPSSSSSVKSSSSSAKSSSSSVKSSSSSVKSSSSSVKSSSSGAKSSSSSVKSSSSSAKSSSSSVKSSSSGAKSSSSTAKSSSSKEALPTLAQVPQFSIETVGRTLQIAGAQVGKAYTLLDLQGHVLKRGVVDSGNFNLGVPSAGTYLVGIGSQARAITVK